MKKAFMQEIGREFGQRTYSGIISYAGMNAVLTGRKALLPSEKQGIYCFG